MVYKFKGYYETSGIIKNNILVPGRYIQEWKTKNKQRNINLVFKKNKIVDLNIQPEEKEVERINFLELGNLSARRDWGFAGDYVEAIWNILQQDKPDDFVISTGEYYSIEDFVREAFSIVGLDWKRFVLKK